MENALAHHMLFVWDEAKRRQNLVKHGLDFAAFAGGFDFGSVVQTAATPSSSGRPRLKWIGVFEGRLVAAAIVAPLGSEAMSLISLRPASRAERNLHDRTQN